MMTKTTQTNGTSYKQNGWIHGSQQDKLITSYENTFMKEAFKVLLV